MMLVIAVFRGEVSELVAELSSGVAFGARPSPAVHSCCRLSHASNGIRRAPSGACLPKVPIGTEPIDHGRSFLLRSGGSMHAWLEPCSSSQLPVRSVQSFAGRCDEESEEVTIRLGTRKSRNYQVGIRPSFQFPGCLGPVRCETSMPPPRQDKGGSLSLRLPQRVLRPLHAADWSIGLAAPLAFNVLLRAAGAVTSVLRIPPASFIMPPGDSRWRTYQLSNTHTWNLHTRGNITTDDDWNPDWQESSVESGLKGAVDRRSDQPGVRWADLVPETSGQVAASVR